MAVEKEEGVEGDMVCVFDNPHRWRLNREKGWRVKWFAHLVTQVGSYILTPGAVALAL